MTGRRILVVEDNERNLKLVRDVLQFAGYEVIAARSGEQGLTLARDLFGRPACVSEKTVATERRPVEAVNL